MKERSVRWLVSGRVQGVGFRWYVLQAAQRLKLDGDVRNLADGRVEVRVAGAPEQVERLLDRVREGPSASRVDAVDESSLDELGGFDGFQVRY